MSTVTTQLLDVELLADELAALVPTAQLVLRAPLEVDGAEVVALVLDDDGDQVEVDPALLRKLLAAHRPRPTRRDRARAAAAAATTVLQLRAVVLQLVDEL